MVSTDLSLKSKPCVATSCHKAYLVILNAERNHSDAFRLIFIILGFAYKKRTAGQCVAFVILCVMLPYFIVSSRSLLMSFPSALPFTSGISVFMIVPFSDGFGFSMPS